MIGIREQEVIQLPTLYRVWMLSWLLVGLISVQGQSSNDKARKGQTAQAQSMQGPSVPVESAEEPVVEEQYLLAAQQNITSFIQSNLWVTTELDRTSCYVGEPIVVGYYLYTRLRSNSRISKRPALNGFSVYDMNTIADQEPVVVKRKGQYFYQHLIRKVQIYAIQSGRYRIDPVETENTIQYAIEGSQMEGAILVPNHVYTASSEEQWVDVKPLPGGDSVGTMAVGQFKLKMRPKGFEPIRAGDPFTLELVLEGTGNLALLPAPKVDWPADWKLISASTTDDFLTLQSPFTGKKIFRYTLIAPQSQQVKLPAVQLRYFNPVNSAYTSTLSNVLEVDVLESDSPEPALLKQLQGNADTSDRTWLWAIPILGLLLAVAWFWKRKSKKAAQVENPVAVIQTRKEYNWDELLFEPDDLRFVQLYYAQLKSISTQQAEWQHWIQFCEQYLYAGKSGPLNRQAMIDAAKSFQV